MFQNIGYLEEKVSKKGNRNLIGMIKVPVAGEHRIIISLKRTKNNSFGVAIMTDDEDESTPKAKDSDKRGDSPSVGKDTDELIF